MPPKLKSINVDFVTADGFNDDGTINMTGFRQVVKRILDAVPLPPKQGGLWCRKCKYVRRVMKITRDGLTFWVCDICGTERLRD